MKLLKIQCYDKWYHVEQNGKKISFYRVDDNHKNYNLTKDEMKLIQFSIDAITPSNNLIKLMD